MPSPLQQAFPKDQKKTQEKLTPNLMDKEQYIVHNRNLKYYLEHRMQLKKIHRVLTFKQSCWLQEYID